MWYEVIGRRCEEANGAVGAMEDAGNTVVFSRKWGSYVESVKTGERIPMVRKGGVCVMVLNAVDGKRGGVKKKRRRLLKRCKWMA